MKIKKIISVLTAIAIASAMTACGKSNSITVISREDGSGTRSAFVEITGVEVKTDDGKTDRTTDEAITANSTSVVMTQVSTNESAIGYISLGSLNDTVKAVKIDGAEPTVENINNGTYKVARPFNIAYLGELSEPAQDFVNFIFSAEGQTVVADAKYITVADTGDFTSSMPSGKVIIAGSSSVTPVMEKLSEAYKAVNPNVTIELQQTDSSSGMKAVANGTADIGMASRELKDSELETLTGIAIAVDGIAVVVNNNNDVDSLTLEQVMNIYIGEITEWSEIK